MVIFLVCSWNKYFKCLWFFFFVALRFNHASFVFVSSGQITSRLFFSKRETKRQRHWNDPHFLFLRCIDQRSKAVGKERLHVLTTTIISFDRSKWRDVFTIWIVRKRAFVMSLSWSICCFRFLLFSVEDLSKVDEKDHQYFTSFTDNKSFELNKSAWCNVNPFLIFFASISIYCQWVLISVIIWLIKAFRSNKSALLMDRVHPSWSISNCDRPFVYLIESLAPKDSYLSCSLNHQFERIFYVRRQKKSFLQ